MALLALTIGCGDEQDPAGSRPTATPTEQAASAPLGRRDTPPAGVAEQIDYFGIGDSPCPNRESETPVIALDYRPLYQFQADPRVEGEVETGEELFICPRGFPFQEPITVRVSGPAGDVEGVEPLDASTETEPVWVLRIDPSLPRGAYEIEAAEGTTTATQPVSVLAPRHQGIRVLTDEPAAPGTDILLVGVGLPPSTSVPIDIYKRGSKRYDYVTSVPIQTDGEGIGSVTVPTTADDGDALYLFHPRVPGPHDQDMDATLFVGT